jgi:hypothetical protein
MGIFRRNTQHLVLDNFPAAVTGADALNLRLSRGFLEYSQRRNFIADPADPDIQKINLKANEAFPMPEVFDMTC